MLKKTDTCELVETLEKRDGVKKIVVEPYENISVTIEGPAVVLVVED